MPKNILSIYVKKRIQFCPYTEKHDQKNPAFRYILRSGKKWQFLIRLPLWFQSLVSFKVVCDRATCKWNFGKKIVKTTSSKNILFFDYFCLQTVSHRKSKSVTIFWKVAVNNDFAKLNGKKPIKIKSRISFHDFQ